MLKETAIKALEELPETATEKDIYEAIFVRLMIEKRYHQIDEGKYSSTSELLEEMETWK